MKNKSTTNINKLNRLYRLVATASERLVAASRGRKPQKDFDAAKNHVDKVSREFDALRAELPPTKFDMGSGKYFFAEEDGKEVFAIRVRRTDTFDVRVAAGSSGEAMDKAMMQIARENGIPLNCLEAEDFSR